MANLPESREGSVEERKRDDTDRVRQLVSRITVVPLSDIDEPIRLGQIYIGNTTRPRLLRMVVKFVESKEKIMRNVYGLNDGMPFEQRIYINNDNTPQEREKYKALKEEMIVCKDNGERDLVIRNLKIVHRKNRIADHPNSHTRLIENTINNTCTNVDVLIVNTPISHAQIDVHTHVNSPLNIHAQVHAPSDVDILTHVNTPVNFRAQIDVDVHTQYHDDKCVMLYSNIDSFLNKISEFLTLIDKRKPKIIALTEIIAKNKHDFHLAEYELPGYDPFVNKDPKRGVAIYNIKPLNAKEVMMDDSIFNESVFCCFNEAMTNLC